MDTLVEALDPAEPQISSDYKAVTVVVLLGVNRHRSIGCRRDQRRSATWEVGWRPASLVQRNDGVANNPYLLLTEHYSYNYKYQLKNR